MMRLGTLPTALRAVRRGTGRGGWAKEVLGRGF
jgi:hypothetical protein